MYKSQTLNDVWSAENSKKAGKPPKKLIKLFIFLLKMKPFCDVFPPISLRLLTDESVSDTRVETPFVWFGCLPDGWIITDQSHKTRLSVNLSSDPHSRRTNCQTHSHTHTHRMKLLLRQIPNFFFSVVTTLAASQHSAAKTCCVSKAQYTGPNHNSVSVSRHFHIKPK